MKSPFVRRRRPVLINSWESFYFDFTEETLLSLAQTAKDVGVELFVLDDGWFSKRNNARSSLGDWYESSEKLPQGLAGFAKKLKNIGLDFGLWMEPEMVSPDSELYRAHPDWIIRVPQAEPVQYRFQYVLDLTRPEVLDFVLCAVSRILDSAPISYLKWDMNRMISDVPRAGYCHEYTLAFYRLLSALTEKYPDVKSCRVGDRVVVETAVSCGHCAHCQSGSKHLCEQCVEVGFPQLDGGYAQYVTCPADCLHKIPANMSYDEGGILEACLCPFGLIYRNGMHPDETVLIQGAGAAGLSFLQSVKLYSPRKVLVAVRKESAEKLAYRFGADVVINTAREDLRRRVAEETGGLGVTLSIDAAGAKTTVYAHSQAVRRSACRIRFRSYAFLLSVIRVVGRIPFQEPR